MNKWITSRNSLGKGFIFVVAALIQIINQIQFQWTQQHWLSLIVSTLITIFNNALHILEHIYFSMDFFFFDFPNNNILLKAIQCATRSIETDTFTMALQCLHIITNCSRQMNGYNF